MYVGHLILIFREVRRVLRKDGTLWLNLGDSYARDARKGQHRPGDSGKQAYAYGRGGGRVSAAAVPRGLKEKDLAGIPWRVAFALQADGWFLRCDVVWDRFNCLPESVRDRPTQSHEYVFLLAKRSRYFYDADAVREPGSPRIRKGGTAPYLAGGSATHGLGSRSLHQPAGGLGRNRRSVWAINTEPFPGTHFAVFPKALAEICILAGTSPRACPACGAPWERVVEKGEPVLGAWSAKGAGQCDIGAGGMRRASLEGGSTLKHAVPTKTVGWQPGCRCSGNDGSGRCVVLDPFGGAGTTTLAAISLGRDSVYIDLKREYAEMALDRCGLREGVQGRLFCPEEWTLEEVGAGSCGAASGVV
jgi:DNA modification methylase